MSAKNQCYLCKHKIPRQICGSSQSIYYNKKIELTDSCDYFLENPAQDYFNLGLAKSLEPETQRESIVQDIETAIRLGLPDDDEMEARFFLGAKYATMGIHQDGTLNPELLSDAINNMEKAVLMDSKGEYGYFSDPLNRARLSKLDIAYVMKARSIQKKEGVDAAITFLEKKGHLSSIPMLNTLLELGNLFYGEKDDNEHASVYYKTVVSAEAVDPVDENGWEANTRQMAKDNLRRIESPDAPTSKSGCFIATAVYGASDAPEVMVFRHFRDEILLSSTTGRKLVSLYYLFSPYAARLIGKSIIAKSVIREVFFKPVIWLINSRRR